MLLLWPRRGLWCLIGVPGAVLKVSRPPDVTGGRESGSGAGDHQGVDGGLDQQVDRFGTPAALVLELQHEPAGLLRHADELPDLAIGRIIGNGTELTGKAIGPNSLQSRVQVTRLEPDGKGSVEWNEKQKDKITARPSLSRGAPKASQTSSIGCRSRPRAERRPRVRRVS